ncbi:30S ribosomal protein S5 [Candidatus Peregrinibacteria bacterium]|nr:30S ribosomal protein S5 [Candidatus Peregrinibacteria bacterium]
MAKTTRPDRKKNARKAREPSEFEETTLSVDRVTRVVAGGRRMRFRAVVVVGDKKGRVGLGTGKANEVQAAVQKAASAAKRAMIRVPLRDGTIPHQIDHKFKAAKIRLMPAFEGTGIKAGGALRVILDHAGVKNVLSKRFGSNNKLVNAQCVMQALDLLKGDRSAPVESKKQEVSAEENELPENLKVKEISRSDIDQEGNLRG